MNARSVAYFSMEIALDAALPTYSGGLGVLAGDTLRSAADVGLPVVAVSLLYRQGYFRQQLDADGRQTESAIKWNPGDLLTPLAEVVSVEVEGRPVKARAWRYLIKGVKGHTVPVYFLDTALSENSAEDQTITDHLYGGDERYRLRQETVLGMGGVQLLEALGVKPDVYHMNEGHAALLTLALLEREPAAAVKERCVFTTHTPVPAGHDTFPVALAESVLGKKRLATLAGLGACPNGRLNMSELAIKLSRYVNGVAKRHAEVSRRMFPGVAIEPITNGVHAVSWTADAMRSLFDEHLPGWREDNNHLRYAVEIPLADLKAAHRKAKAALFEEIASRTGVQLSVDAFTIGFARRAAEYKRADLLFHDPKKLADLTKHGPLQIVFGGKAHPRDFGGKKLIEKVHAGAKAVAGFGIQVVYLENYDITLGRLITSGVDLWLNTPVKPLEASGTSGMKAALNGVPSLSTLDGGWVEGLVPGVTGWEIDDPADAFAGAVDDGQHRDVAAASIYQLLSSEIMPAYYRVPEKYLGVMRNSIYLNGPFFSTQRMVLQYFTQAYTKRAD